MKQADDSIPATWKSGDALRSWAKGRVITVSDLHGRAGEITARPFSAASTRQLDEITLALDLYEELDAE